MLCLKVLDPCRGQGAFYDNLVSGRITELHWCELSEGRDFFAYNSEVDWIITNPPWSKMQRFLEHGMTLANDIVYLSTINHYTTKKRIRDMRKAGFGIKEIYCVATPKSPWPQSGFQLAAIHTRKHYKGETTFSYSPQLSF